MTVDRMTLAGRIVGEVVELADPTWASGTDTGYELPPGSLCQVSWHRPSTAPEVTFISVYTESLARFGAPVPVPSTARIRRVVVSRDVKTGTFAKDETDPLTRGSRGFGELFGGEK